MQNEYLNDKELREKLSKISIGYTEEHHLYIDKDGLAMGEILAPLQQKIEEARRQGIGEVVDYFSRHWMGATKGMLIYEIPDKDRQLLEEGSIPVALKGGGK